jgi:hypothetical protein
MNGDDRMFLGDRFIFLPTDYRYLVDVFYRAKKKPRTIAKFRTKYSTVILLVIVVGGVVVGWGISPQQRYGKYISGQTSSSA